MKKEFVYAVRYPIAMHIGCIRLQMMAHTMGEKCAKTKGKTTFQWMLDNDNAALEKRYYRAR
jgi:hypothetical protein